MGSTRINRAMTRNVWRLFPEPETVTLFVRATGEGFTASPVAVQNARPSPNRKGMREAGPGKLVASRMRWLLPAAFLGGVVPKPGDVIQRAGGERWTISSDEDAVDANLFSNIYACWAVRERP